MNLGALVSETRNPDTMDLDRLSTLEMMQRFNAEDQKVPLAVQQVLPQIAQVVDAAVSCFQQGGRLIYLGAGTSGRLGVLDASECPPTFGVEPEMVVGLIAGGIGALLKAVEGAEDSLTLGIEDLQRINLRQQDMVIGLAASGRTPYVIGALRYAKQQGCITASVSCNPNAEIAAIVDIAITPEVGPEALTGSTRMKAGTAQKLVLNMISTGAMVKVGKVYQNLMVDVRATNIKLIDRACRIVVEAAGVSREQAERLLKQTDYEVKPAILMALTGISVELAQQKLKQTTGQLALAIQGFSSLE